MARPIPWQIHETAYHIHFKTPISRDRYNALVRRGVMRYADFWDIVPKAGKPGGLTIRGGDLNDIPAWAVYDRPNSVVLTTTLQNHPRAPAGTGWSESGLEGVIPHEFGHHYLTYRHLDELPDYYGDPKFSHVMKLGAGTYMYELGVFSPAEVAFGLTRGFQLAKKPSHPQARRHAANMVNWNKYIKLYRDRRDAAKAKGDKKTAERNQQLIDKTAKIRNDSIALTKKIVLLYPPGHHARMFSWQASKAVMGAREEADATNVEAAYTEQAKAAIAAAERSAAAAKRTACNFGDPFVMI